MYVLLQLSLMLLKSCTTHCSHLLQGSPRIPSLLLPPTGLRVDVQVGCVHNVLDISLGQAFMPLAISAIGVTVPDSRHIGTLLSRLCFAFAIRAGCLEIGLKCTPAANCCSRRPSTEQCHIANQVSSFMQRLDQPLGDVLPWRGFFSESARSGALIYEDIYEVPALTCRPTLHPATPAS